MFENIFKQSDHIKHRTNSFIHFRFIDKMHYVAHRVYYNMSKQ